MSKQRLSTGRFKDLIKKISKLFEIDNPKIDLIVDDLRRGMIKIPNSMLDTNLPLKNNTRVLINVDFKERMSSRSMGALNYLNSIDSGIVIPNQEDKSSVQLHAVKLLDNESAIFKNSK